ncbi:unnamed product [Ostreococcus tauri]|uniref:Unnamed product n=1 Tax=Ostreococcus tauri TaxID=70448 RepID=A0A090N2Y3_OSTTA|nr:unnamed product [Ostreococcus tauri]CEF97168.1 unnamed product [Ostreococcus tauri]|eukprot:XP_022838523.1 unnamed product [Ostreococcus tauri]
MELVTAIAIACGIGAVKVSLGGAALYYYGERWFPEEWRARLPWGVATEGDEGEDELARGKAKRA